MGRHSYAAYKVDLISCVDVDTTTLPPKTRPTGSHVNQVCVRPLTRDSTLQALMHMQHGERSHVTGLGRPHQSTNNCVRQLQCPSPRTVHLHRGYSKWWIPTTCCTTRHQIVRHGPSWNEHRGFYSSSQSLACRFPQPRASRPKDADQ